MFSLYIALYLLLDITSVLRLFPVSRIFPAWNYLRLNKPATANIAPIQ